MKNILSVLFLTLLSIAAFPQTGSISGTIVDENNKELPGITVELSGKNKFTSTDENGQFLFRNLEAGNYTLSITGVGFVAKKENIAVTENDNTTITLRLIGKTQSLEEVIIKGRIGGYNSTKQLNTKLPARLIDIPQNAKVLGRDLLDDKQALSFKEVLPYVSGINSHRHLNDIVIRGFETTGGGATGSLQFINGMRNFFTSYEHDLNLTNIEKIEVLKGNTALLYGAILPGGAINVVTKKPLFANRVSAGVSGGTWGRYRLDADVTGAIGTDKKIAYRFNMGYQSSPDMREFYFNKTGSASGAFTFRPSEKTRIDVEISYLGIHRNSWVEWGVPAWGTDLFALPVSYTSHEPTDFSKWKNVMGMLSVEHRINNKLAVYVNMNGSGNVNDAETHAPAFISPFPKGDSSVRRIFRDVVQQNDAFTANVYLKWNTNTGRVKHTITFGIDVMHGRLTSDVKQADSAQGVPRINVFNPRYRTVTTDNYVITPTAGFFGNTRIEFYGIYLMDFIEITPRLKALLAGRFDYYDQWGISYSNINTIFHNINRPFIPTFGITYNIQKDFSVFATYSKGFTPQTNQDPALGGPWEPMYSDQLEAGLKKDFANGRWSTTASVYKINRLNILVPQDPSNSFGPQVSEGEQTGTGFEWDINGSITDNWSMVGAFSYTDTRVTKTTRPIEKDLRTINSPYVLASAWSKYAFTQFLNGIAIGLGCRHASGAITAGDRFTPTNLPVKIPAYTIFDAALYYRINSVQLSLNADNIFNKRYIASARHTGYMQPGLPRNLLFRVQVTL